MPRNSSAASSSALGENFSVFRQILRSEKMPPEEDLSGLWGELCAARLKTFVFQVFTNQSDGIVNLPAYAAWLLFHAFAWKGTGRADDGRASDYLIRSAIGFIRLNNQWLCVRDELTKFAELAQQELNKRSETECRVLGVSKAPVTRETQGKEPKRSTTNGEARTKLIAALSAHHGFDEGICRNSEPIRSNELARLADVGKATASDFFRDKFKGHTKYKLECATNIANVARKLKQLRGEFTDSDVKAIVEVDRAFRPD